MNTQKLKQVHTKSIEILEAIETWQHCKEGMKENLTMSICEPGSNIESHYKHKLDIYERCIHRMEKYYYNYLLKNL